MICRQALMQAGKSKRFADGYSEGPRCVLSALHCVKLQSGFFEHTLVSRITIRFALELAGKPYDLLASTNTSRLTIRLADGCSKDPCCVFSALDCVKLQHGPSAHPSTSRIVIRIALELVGKPYHLLASSNAGHITKRIADGYSKGPRCVFSALNCVKLLSGLFVHPSVSRITIRLGLELADKPYDLPASSNASRLIIRFALRFQRFRMPKVATRTFEPPIRNTYYHTAWCSEDPSCVFSALECLKLQRGPSDHPSASCITIRLALELVGKPYDLPTSSNANRITKRLDNGCSKDPRCVFSVLDCVKLQRGPFKHTSINRIIIRPELELVGNPYDLSASSNTKLLTIRLGDGCSKDPRYVFSALDCVKLQRGSSEYPSASRVTIRLALALAGKPYDLPANSNANRITKCLVDVCSEGPRCILSALECVKLHDLSTSSNASRSAEGPRCDFSALECVKIQRGPLKQPSASRITIRLALELIDKPYDLPVSSNASRITKLLANGCSKDPRCVYCDLNYVKLQRGFFEDPSTSRITIRLALEFADNPYDLPVSSNASRLTIRLFNECSKSPRCVFSVLNCVKLQRGTFEHSSANRITTRLALELVSRSYDLSASSNANRINKRFSDGCSEGSHCVFSALNCVKLQRGPFEHPSASSITIRLALELANNPYDFPVSSNGSRITKRLADGCSECSRCVFSDFDCVKLQRGSSEHPSVSRITIHLALELTGKPYDFPTSSNASWLTIRLVDECSKGPRCVFSSLYYLELQRKASEHASASRITIQLALELGGKPYDLPASSNAIRLTIRLADGCSEGLRCVFSALDFVKLQRGPFEHSSASRITTRLALELVSIPYDFSASSNANCINKRFADGCSEGKPYDLPASSNASRLTIRLVDGCSEGLRCGFSALYYVKLKRGPSEHSSAIRINTQLALELVSKPYDLSASSNANRINKRFTDGCSEGPRCIFSALYCVKLQTKAFEHRIMIRFTLELTGKLYDLSTSSDTSRLTIWLPDGYSKASRCVFSALNCIKLQRGPSEHPPASCITIRLALELPDKPYYLSTISNASRITKRLADGCWKDLRCVFSALDCVKLQRKSSEHPSASRITIRLALELAGKPYDLPTRSNASQLTIRLADGCSNVRVVFSVL
ncbi:hypothetical protein L7F22_024638 [Adiantum nelumboides]|nr:hypothetical protein [Adiantum nelumboides]